MKGTANIIRAVFGDPDGTYTATILRDRLDRPSKARLNPPELCATNGVRYFALLGGIELADEAGAYELEEFSGSPFNGFQMDLPYQVRNDGMREAFNKGDGLPNSWTESPESCVFHEVDIWDKINRQCKGQDLFRSEPGSRPVLIFSGRGGKSELHMAAGSHAWTIGHVRRGDPTESATENRPPRVSRGKGEKAGQEPTGSTRERRVHGKPPAEQDQVREESRTRTSRSGARRPVSLNVPFAGSHSRVGRTCSTAMWYPDKWLPLPPALCSAGKTEFGLSAHSVTC